MVLKNKLSECKKINLNPGFNIITKQVKGIILNVNLYYNLREELKIHFDPNFDKPEQNNQIKEEKKINKNLYLLKI